MPEIVLIACYISVNGPGSPPLGTTPFASSPEGLPATLSVLGFLKFSHMFLGARLLREPRTRRLPVAMTQGLGQLERPGSLAQHR